MTVADGGTGASDVATARQNLGLEIGVDVQGYDADLADLADGTLSASKVKMVNILSHLLGRMVKYGLQTEMERDLGKHQVVLFLVQHLQ